MSAATVGMPQPRNVPTPPRNNAKAMPYQIRWTVLGEVRNHLRETSSAYSLDQANLRVALKVVRTLDNATR